MGKAESRLKMLGNMKQGRKRSRVLRLKKSILMFVSVNRNAKELVQSHIGILDKCLRKRSNIIQKARARRRQGISECTGRRNRRWIGFILVRNFPNTMFGEWEWLIGVTA